MFPKTKNIHMVASFTSHLPLLLFFFFFFFYGFHVCVSSGHGKFETLGALGISAMLLATGCGIAWHAADLLLVCINPIFIGVVYFKL